MKSFFNRYRAHQKGFSSRFRFMKAAHEMGGKKILLVTYEYPPDLGGVASYLGGLFGALPEVRVLKLPQPKFPFAWLLQLPKMWKAARAADLVAVSHLLPLGTAAMLLGKPYVVVVHGLDLRLARRKKGLASRVLKKARLIVANSRSTASELPFFGLPAASALVLTPGFDPSFEKFAEKAGHSAFQASLLSVGRFVPRKGFDRLIGLLPKLRERCGDVMLILAGSGPEEGKLRQEAKKLGMSAHVQFVIAPDRVTLAAHYWACEVFALAARASEDDVEGFGIVCLEAALFGKPVVATRAGGLAEAVADNETGLLADPGSDQELLEKLASLFADHERARRLGAAGRARVLRDFRWEDRAKLLRERLA